MVPSRGDAAGNSGEYNICIRDSGCVFDSVLIFAGWLSLTTLPVTVTGLGAKQAIFCWIIQFRPDRPFNATKHLLPSQHLTRVARDYPSGVKTTEGQPRSSPRSQRPQSWH